MTCLLATTPYSRVWPDDSPLFTAHTASYRVHLVCIPLFPARKTVLYCRPTSGFSKYPYSRVWPDYSSFFLCRYGVLPLSSNMYTSIPCTENRAILLSEVKIFKIYHAKILRKLKFCFSPNDQSLRLWKSSLTQNWIRSTIFEKLIFT